MELEPGTSEAPCVASTQASVISASCVQTIVWHPDAFKWNTLELREIRWIEHEPPEIETSLLGVKFRFLLFCLRHFLTLSILLGSLRVFHIPEEARKYQTSMQLSKGYSKSILIF
ncbi:hypothetical protein FVEG_15403 [Fusarium verticillioides 7600]|uniref:Uncharacterized protein n=1 Tax=Gibberella moniliformis (strain M3125 / FGSC 7600) TaxID=334819 RepID=W7M3U2_GIBM7|nr:hypothetical protein FVEG_15403 [Fusarium verticillioides 7600]EWG42204.1 hypothetical protein FVEG_15403 [Fusarium verticillioides 7600]